ncbi:uncharacterized protein [Procambarus clarkii]|uniref:uncharacterized protein n=1 Tax=Procambarus clarkii TaxID=6728 RepID=UPI003743C14B
MRIMADTSSLLLILVSGCCLTSLLPLSSAQGRKVGPPSTPSQGARVDARHSVLPLVKFECVGRTGGYYGDMDFGCSVFHYCTDSGQRFTFQCSEGLKFNERTTSCSAGYFGDCTHPETVGPAGHKSTDPEPVRSFQKISANVGRDDDDDDHQQDPSDIPEPYIRQDDPALDSDYNYEYYDTDDGQSVTQDVKPAASNRVIKNTNVKDLSSNGWGKSMMSTLSAFASLANIPYDTASTNEERVDRVDELKQVKYIDTIDRAFIARPSERTRPAQRQSSSHFFQLPFFQGKAKKPSHVPQRTLGGEQSFINHRSPYQPSPSDDYNPRAEASYEEPSDYGRQSQPYDFEDSLEADDGSYNPDVSQTTPDTFRPSSRITNDPDDFQPVTPASKKSSSRESLDLVRPNRDATHQTGHGALSSSFQSFSPSASPFRSQVGFSAPSSFGVPKTSRTAQTSPPSFLPAPSFPSSGNFVFNQPPINPSIFNRPLHHAPPPSRTTFGAPPAPRQQVDSFGRPSPEHQVDIFGRPSSSEQHVDIFGRPSSSEQQVDIFGRPSSSEHQVNTFGRPSSSRQHLDSFGRPSSSQQPEDNFGRPTPPQQSVHSFGRPSSPQQPVDSFGRPSSPQQPVDSFGRPSSPQQPIHSFSHPPGLRPVQSFSHQPIPSFGHSPASQPVPSFSSPPVSQLGQNFSPSPSPQPVQIFRRPTFPPHQPQSFGPPTHPPAGSNFGPPPASFSFSQPPIQQQPVQPFGRPTVSPAFIPHTTATSVIQKPFTQGSSRRGQLFNIFSRSRTLSRILQKNHRQLSQLFLKQRKLFQMKNPQHSLHEVLLETESLTFSEQP